MVQEHRAEYPSEWATITSITRKLGIVQDPDILVGKPTVRRTRIPGEPVLAKLAHNPDLDKLFVDYPRLTVEDVKACLEYAGWENVAVGSRMKYSGLVATAAPTGRRARHQRGSHG